jgi:signal transduction histidine kinase
MLDKSGPGHLALQRSYTSCVQVYLSQLTPLPICDTIRIMQHSPMDSTYIVNAPESFVRSEDNSLPNALLATLLDANREGVVVFDSDVRLQVINRQALHYLNLPGAPKDWHHRDLPDFSAELRIYAPEALDRLRSELMRFLGGDESQGEGEFHTDYGVIRFQTLSMEAGSPASMPAASSWRLVILSAVTPDEASKAEGWDLVRRLMDGLQKPLIYVREAMRYIVADGGDSLSEASQEALLVALGEADGTLATIRQLADFSRLDVGQMPLCMSAFAIADVVDRVLEMQKPAAQQRSLKLEQRVSPSLPLVWGDRDLIKRMLEVLVSGVLDLAPPGGVVRVEVDVACAEPVRFLISISDRPGTSPEESMKADATRVREPSPAYDYAATLHDLNVAFCRKVVEAHGERFSIAQDRPTGLVISFTLPKVSESLASIGPAPM